MEAIRDFLLVQLGEKVDKITRYAGEINLNFKCTFSNNKSYNLKLFHPTTDPQFVDFLAKVHLHCNTINYIHVAKIIPWKSKDYIHKVSYDGEMYQAILLDWIDGKLLSEIEYHPQKLLYNWGELSAKLQQSLDSFEHPYLERIFDWDCLQLELHRDKIQYLRTDQERECIHDIFHRFSQKSTELKSLPKAINHNDLHTENLLIRFDGYEPKLEGLIDFGDVLKTARICEIGIACAYAMMDKKDILSAAGNILKGYASHVKLQENEVKCIDLLIRARLAISVLTSAKKRADGVTEEYQFISEKKAWEVLKKLGSFPKNFIHYYYRASVGLSAHPNEKKFKEWCENNTSSFKEVIKLNPNSSGHIDLSVSSSVIPSTAEFENINQFNKRIQAFKEENNFVAAYGGYGEIRPFYTTDNYETENDQGYQWRTQHLGLDVWTDLTDGNGKRIEINCPYDGEIICSHNNDLTCDYGGTLIIKYNAEDFSYYTLYGHLSLDI